MIFFPRDAFAAITNFAKGIIKIAAVEAYPI
jgi:hypothetical protein